MDLDLEVDPFGHYVQHSNRSSKQLLLPACCISFMDSDFILFLACLLFNASIVRCTIVVGLLHLALLCYIPS